MKMLEYGRENRPTLLFLPCTAEPDWAFTDSVTLLARTYHVIQVVYDGHGGTGEDFVSVEATVDAVTDCVCLLARRRVSDAAAGAGANAGAARYHRRRNDAVSAPAAGAAADESR